jgi:hypothetical protein
MKNGFIFSTMVLCMGITARPAFGKGIPERYHTYDEVAVRLDSIARGYPAIVRLDTLNYSTTDSLPIFAVKISDNVGVEEDEPALLYNGLHHSEEILSVEVCMYMIEDLASRYGTDSTVTRWVDSLEIWIVPVINPDGHNVVMSCIDTIWRKNTRDNNGNGFFDTDSDGVDLNRNYDFLWAAGGSGDHTSEYYRGTAPFSERGTQAIRDLALAQNFVFDICYHSARTGAAEVIYYPWRWHGQYSADHPAMKQVVDTLADRIVNDAGGDGRYIPIWGTAEQGGSGRNWFYGDRGTFSFTIEISTGCILPGELVDDIVLRNSVGAYFLLDRTLGTSLTGCITDSVSGDPIVAEVRILEAHSDSVTPRLSDTGFGRYRRILTAGEYTLQVLKDGYYTVTVPSITVDTGEVKTVNVKLPKMAVEEGGNYQFPIGNGQLSVHPNPFVGFAKARGSVGAQGFVPVHAYDMMGRLVEETDGTAIGERLESGIYFLKAKGYEPVKIVKLR